MKYRQIIISALLLQFMPCMAQNFQGFINRLNTLPENSRQAVCDSFILAQARFPVTENDSLCHFIYTGTASQVSLAGDASSWNPSFNLEKVIGANFWYFSTVYEPDARLDYKYVINNSNWILDPRNPFTCQGGFGANSELRMPQYDPSPEIIYNPGIAHGSLWDSSFYSQQLQNSRKIWIYTPPAYSSANSYQSIYIHDGDGYLALASIRNVLDNMIAENRIEPIIAVFIPPVNRTSEYAGNQQAAFTQFVTEQIVPWVDAHYSTIKSPAKRATLGASNGGNIALWLGVDNPDVFGMIAAQSSNVQSNITNKLENSGPLDLKFYLDIGTYDIPVLIPMVRSFYQFLKNLGYSPTYQEFHEGHSWGNWKARLDDIFEFFFAKSSGSNEIVNDSKYSFQFDSVSRVLQIINTSAYSESLLLELYDFSGRRLFTTRPAKVSAGKIQCSIPENIKGPVVITLMEGQRTQSFKVSLD